MKVLNDLQMNKNEVKGFVVDRLPVAPSDPKDGMIYYNTVTNKFYMYENGTWLVTGSSGGNSVNAISALSATSSVLWQGSLSNKGDSATLSVSLEEFDYILVEAFYTMNAGQKRFLPVSMFAVNDIKNTYGLNIKFVSDVFNDLSSYVQFYYGFDNATNFNIYSINKGGQAGSATVTRVLGLKLDGNANTDAAPVGNVISFMGTAAPNGYLVCDGSEYNIVDYPNLASHFETQFGTKNHFGGDGETTFAVPTLSLHPTEIAMINCIKY